MFSYWRSNEFYLKLSIVKFYSRPLSILKPPLSSPKLLNHPTSTLQFSEDTEWNGSGSGSGDSTDQDPITDDEDGFKEGSGYEPKYSPSETPKPPPVHPEVVPPRVEVDQKTSVTSNNDNNNSNNNNNSNSNNGTSSVDSGASRQKISLSRALTTYLVPIVVMWFGGCLTEWL